MPSAPLRVGVITEIPTPYRLPLYERLSAQPDIDLEVLFCAADEPDRPWHADEALNRIPHRFLRGWAPAIRTRRNTFVYEINPEIVKLLRASRYDALVIGGYGVFTEQVSIAYARLVGTPYLLHSESHHGKARSGAKRRVKQMLLPHIVGSASAGLAVGSLAASYLESYGLPRSQIRIVPNTIDVEAYAAAAQVARAKERAVRARLGLPPRFSLFVGRLVEAKGIAQLLKAQKDAGDQAAPLVVAGDGPLRGDVEAAPGVTALGFLQPNDLIEVFALAERTVVPSISEPWGVVVNEALACGSPVIATDAVGAAFDLVRDGIDGRIVPAGDVAALARALSEALPALEPASGPIRRWNYDFTVSQFVEGLSLAMNAS
jgi:glycosyltransferase involved in cell wall biosynthesis